MAWRGNNFGGALDGGRDWLEERHFEVAREAGFDTVRLPVKWQLQDGFDRIDRAIETALLASALEVVRATNPRRLVLAGP